MGAGFVRGAVALSGFVALLTTTAGAAHAIAPPPPQPYLQGLDATEATALLVRLTEAQAGLRDGAPLTFMLLSGSLASSPMADVSAQDAFLALSVDHPLHIRRAEGQDPSWQSYMIGYRADDPGQMVWSVEVVTGWNGNIERVEMNYAPPPPF